MTQLGLVLNPSVDPRDESRLSAQCSRLLDALRKGPLTNVAAMERLRIFNLSARTSELRQAGYEITATRIGNGLFEYTLKGE